MLHDRQNRTSAAFVAASAHQAVSLALRGTEAKSRVDMAAISPDVCATLLFLLAEAHANAVEAAKRIVAAEDAGPIERARLMAIRGLAQGNLSEVADAEEPEINLDGDDLGFRDLDALRLLLLRSVTNLARQLRVPAPSCLANPPIITVEAFLHSAHRSVGKYYFRCGCLTSEWKSKGVQMVEHSLSRL